MPDTSITTATSVNHDPRPDLRTLLLAQKTEVIGELTRAIGNQFNNTMMGITSYSELVLKKLPPAERRNLEQVLKSAGIATGLVQKLLSISRNLPASQQSVDLNVLIVGIVPLLEQLAGEQVAMAYDLAPTLPATSADAAQLEQVILSLAINARNAMSEGGTLTVRTKSAGLTKETLGESESPGEYVLLSVDDTGVARATEMSDASSLHEQDARMNLSLAAVRAVAKNAEAVVRFSSDPKNGSSFKIYFPAQLSVAGPHERSAPRNLPTARTILIVEDDDAVRVPTAELLKMEGFKVLQARTGAEAIRVVEQNRSNLDILVTDVLMPKMTGQEVAETLLQMNSDLKVLFISGEDMEGFTPGAAKAVLRKPFRLDALKDKIHELLGQ